MRDGRRQSHAGYPNQRRHPQNRQIHLRPLGRESRQNLRNAVRQPIRPIESNEYARKKIMQSVHILLYNNICYDGKTT